MRSKSLLLTHKQLLSRSVSNFTQTDSRSQYEDEIIEHMCRLFCCSFSLPPDRIVCTETGVVPHGNSISGYDSYRNPSARWCSFTRNTLSRPPYRKGTEQNWVQRETLTTDGSGGRRRQWHSSGAETRQGHRPHCDDDHPLALADLAGDTARGLIGVGPRRFRHGPAAPHRRRRP